jgi:hypothetical protein
VNYGVPVGWLRHGRGYARECVCTQRPKTALAYALTVWSAMAGVAESGGERREKPGLTVGVGVDWIAVLWRVMAV